MHFLIIWFASLFCSTNTSEIITSCDYFEVDHLGNIYVVTNSELSKYDTDANKIYNYSDASLGNISFIDTSDPLRILVFYQDFNQLVYLNNKLTKIGNEIDLYDFSVNETDLVCNSQNGGFWIYNSIENQATHVSNNGNITKQSMLLGSFFGNSEIMKISEKNSNLYLLFAKNGILQLDQNGQFIRKLIINGIQDFQVQGNFIYYQKEKGFYKYLPLNQEDQMIYSKASSEKKTIRINKDKIFISNEKSISIKILSF